MKWICSAANQTMDDLINDTSYTDADIEAATKTSEGMNGYKFHVNQTTLRLPNKEEIHLCRRNDETNRVSRRTCIWKDEGWWQTL